MTAPASFSAAFPARQAVSFQVTFASRGIRIYPGEPGGRDRTFVGLRLPTTAWLPAFRRGCGYGYIARLSKGQGPPRAAIFPEKTAGVTDDI